MKITDSIDFTSIIKLQYAEQQGKIIQILMGNNWIALTYQMCDYEFATGILEAK